jgi:hypothetical protein
MGQIAQNGKLPKGEFAQWPKAWNGHPAREQSWTGCLCHEEVDEVVVIPLLIQAGWRAERRGGYFLKPKT